MAGHLGSAIVVPVLLRGATFARLPREELAARAGMNVQTHSRNGQ